MIMDELYTYIGSKRKKYYLWTSMAFTKTGKKFYYYYLSRHKSTQALFLFNQQLPYINIVYADGNFAYDSVYGNKAIQEKSATTNIICKYGFRFAT